MTEQQPLVIFKTLNGHLELYTDRIIIHKQGWLTPFMYNFRESQLTIELQQVTTVRIFNPQILLNGLLIIKFLNGQERIIALVYGASQHHNALKIRDTIEDYLSRRDVYPFIKENFLKKRANSHTPP